MACFSRDKVGARHVYIITFKPSSYVESWKMVHFAEFDRSYRYFCIVPGSETEYLQHDSIALTFTGFVSKKTNLWVKSDFRYLFGRVGYHPIAVLPKISVWCQKAAACRFCIEEELADFDSYEEEEERLPCNWTYFIICILMHPVIAYYTGQVSVFFFKHGRFK